MMLPSLRLPKKKTNKIEKMNSTSTSSKNTFINADTDKVIVYISACKPSFLLAKRTILVTRITRIILANCGPKLKDSDAFFIVKVIRMSMIEEMTMKASNLLESVSK